MQVMQALLNRVSAARLTEPAPDAQQRDLMFRAALRAPDHGQLRPWRFLTIEGAAREQLGELFAQSLLQNTSEPSAALLEKARAMPLRAPLLVVVIACLHDHPKVPHSEQRLTVGCAAHGMLLAAYAQGFGAIWRTGDMAYNAHVAQGLGLAANEELLGYLYLGTPLAPLRAAPQLDPETYVASWPG